MLANDLKNTLLSEIGSGDVNAVVHTAYGQPRAEQPVSARLGYNGEFSELQTGWQLLGNGYRAYNPRLMRFQSPDSLSPFRDGGMNAYGYCGGDPINRSDPSGHRFTWGRVMRYIGVPTKSNVLAKKEASAVTNGGEPYHWGSNIVTKRLDDVVVDSRSSVARLEQHRAVKFHNINFDLEIENLSDYQELLNVVKGKVYAKPVNINTRVNRIALRRAEQDNIYNTHIRPLVDKPPSYEVASGLPTYDMAIKASMVRGTANP